MYDNQQPPPGGGPQRTFFLADLLNGIQQQQYYQQQQYSQRLPPPPPPDSKEAVEAYVQHMNLLNRQEEERLRQMINQTAQGAIVCQQMHGKNYLVGLEELRSALSNYQVAEEQKGIGEGGPTLGPAFDEINRGLIQNRYVDLYDRWLKDVIIPAAEEAAKND